MAGGTTGRHDMTKRAVRGALRLLPRTRWGDFLHTLIFFLYAHRRLPRRRSGLFNDYMFFLKNSPDMADPLRQITSDKVYAKYFIDQIAGRKVTPETYAVFRSVDEIRASTLPGRCVLKPSHSSGVVVFLEEPGQRPTEDDLAQLGAALEHDLYVERREINYRHLRKRIICEELLQDRRTVKDYKLLCYRGRLRFVQVDWDRHGLRKQNFYDRDWGKIQISFDHHPTGEWEPMPAPFPEMREIAEKIAAHFESVRVDLYVVGDRVYVGEITHCQNQANGVFGSFEEERRVSSLYFGAGRAPRTLCDGSRRSAESASGRSGA